MVSSTFSFLAATTLLVSSPTAAQMIGNWDILYQALTTNFQKTVANKIAVDYCIGRDARIRWIFLKRTVSG